MQLGPFELKLKRKARVREFGNNLVQYAGDLLIQLEALQGASTNRYVTREAQIDETIRKYRGQAAKGNILVRNILETRSAFTVGRGLSVRWQGEAEKLFIERFFKLNRINLAYLRQLGRERSFEGQVLLALDQHLDTVPRVRFVSWYDTRYELVTDSTDYGQIRWCNLLTAGREVKLEPERIAFMKFQTRMNSMVGTPLFAGILNQIEDLDDALTLLKKALSATANPTPYFQFDEEDDANAFRAYLASSAWKMGDALAGSGSATMLQIGYGPYTGIVSQIGELAKIISGHTAVPAHYFGFAEMVSNRATADDMGKAFVAISETETEEWGQGFTDLVGRAMALHNAETGSNLSYDGRIEIEVISEQDFARVAGIWLPIWLAGGITTETFLAKVPGVDEATEAPKVKRETEKRGATPGEALPEERKVGLDALKTFGGGQVM